jgi:hypothetical protein
LLVIPSKNWINSCKIRISLINVSLSQLWQFLAIWIVYSRAHKNILKNSLLVKVSKFFREVFRLEFNHLQIKSLNIYPYELNNFGKRMRFFELNAFRHFDYLAHLTRIRMLEWFLVNVEAKLNNFNLWRAI